MKKIIYILFFTGFISFAYAQDSDEFVVPLSDPGKKGKLVVDIKKGNVEIKGTGRKDILVRYTAEKSKSKNGEVNKQGLKVYSGLTVDLEVVEHNNILDIDSDSYNKAVDLYIEVPLEIDLDVATYNNGDVIISNVSGELVADNYNGRITAENIAGSLVADTYNGRIKVIFSSVTPETPMAFTTYNGDVDLTFPPNFKADLKMRTKQGEILSGFDMQVKRTEPITKKSSKSGTYKVYIDDWVQATINGGGPELMIRNYNGDIIIRKGN